jgi:hypothetical protein
MLAMMKIPPHPSRHGDALSLLSSASQSNHIKERPESPSTLPPSKRLRSHHSPMPHEMHDENDSQTDTAMREDDGDQDGGDGAADGDDDDDSESESPSPPASPHAQGTSTGNSGAAGINGVTTNGLVPNGLADANAPSRRVKGDGAGGSSCHQCKSRRSAGDLTYCSASLNKKNKNAVCRKKYCEHW